MSRPGRSEFALYLRHRPLVWGLVLAVTLAALVWLAWRTAQVPDSPFTYRVR